MGWIWLLFVAFAVFSNLMEKAAKQRRPSGLPRKDQGGGSPAPKPVAFPPFFFENDDEIEKPLPVREVKAGPEPVGQDQPGKSRSRSVKSMTKKPRMSRSKRTNSSWDDEFDHESMADLKMTELSEDLNEDTGLDGFPIGLENRQGGYESQQFLSAIVLAQVMARPDFKTTPWQRRL